MTVSNFDTPMFGIGRLLTEGSRFVVPSHQRDYSWTEDEIDQLFTDIEEARSARRNEYFIGLMVFKPRDEGEFAILDGQQRLATTMIILASIRNWLRKYGLVEDAGEIQRRYIAAKELGEDKLEPRIILNEKNRSAFDDFVVGEKPSKDVQVELSGLKRYDPNRRLLEAILFCRDKVDKIAKDAEGNDQQRAKILFALVRYLRDNVKIVRLTVPSEANAYTVFETLNDRGLDLSVLDLVKNHFFHTAGEAGRLPSMEVRWAQMMANLANVRADDFLKAYWTSRHGRIQTSQLFQSFNTEVNSPSSVFTTSDDMMTASEHYSSLEVADDPIWAEISPNARERIRVLKLLGSRQAHPVLLSALVRFPQKQLERLLRLLEILIVRYQLIGGRRTGRLEISCAALAVEIYKSKIKTATEAFNALKDIYPADNEFFDAFKIKQEKNNRKTKYILNRLERRARQTSAAGELEPSLSLTVEHILPENPSNEWEGVLKQDPTLADDCTYRLGNLCLLGSVNKDLANKSFIKKRKSYEKSDLLFTKNVASFSEWNRKSIEKRQQEMAKIAKAAWQFE